MSRNPLDRKVLAWISEGVDSERDDERFDALALELFRYQYQHNPPYRRMCDAFQRPPEAVSHWAGIPPVPTGAFKEARLATFPPAREVRAFRTSGSTAEGRGVLHLDTLELYEASLLASFRAFICPDLPSLEQGLQLAVLALPAADAPDSSLAYMFDCAVRRLGAPTSRFYMDAQGLSLDALAQDLSRARGPVAVVGTAFAFVHLIDGLAPRGVKLALPAGSRVMETGGFKGRSRELTREALHGGITEMLGVPRERIVNQYGMCELGSQFYEGSLRTGEPSSTKQVPPWVRTRVVDPATGGDVPPGSTGVLIHYDLANTGSVLAVETSDAGRSSGDGFEVLGRIEGAETRGCSIAADALLGAAGVALR